MNQDLEEIKKLRDYIVGVEMHLSILELDIAAADRDVEFLKDMDSVLIENIEVLKMDKIVAVASEYKKIVRELKDIQENVDYYVNMKIKLTKEFEKYTKIKESSLEEFHAKKDKFEKRTFVLPFDASKRRKK